jgi:hypothetical protein
LKNGKTDFNTLRNRSKKIFSRILGSSFGGGTVLSCDCSSKYSAAVSGLPSTGERAAVIISVRRISSGISSGGGSDEAGELKILTIIVKALVIQIRTIMKKIFLVLTSIMVESPKLNKDRHVAEPHYRETIPK